MLASTTEVLDQDVGRDETAKVAEHDRVLAKRLTPATDDDGRNAADEHSDVTEDGRFLAQRLTNWLVPQLCQREDEQEHRCSCKQVDADRGCPSEHAEAALPSLQNTGCQKDGFLDEELQKPLGSPSSQQRSRQQRRSPSRSLAGRLRPQHAAQLVASRSCLEEGEARTEEAT